jgi:hypothetical protein
MGRQYCTGGLAELRSVDEGIMSSTERAAYRPSSGCDPPSNLTRGRYISSRPPEITDDSLPEFLSEFHGYPFERMNGRKRSRVLKPALIIGLLVSAFAILLTTFDSNDFRVMANKTKVAVDGATKDIRAKLTASNPMATNPLPPAVTEDAHATVGAASRGAGLIENRPLPIPPVNTEQEGPPPKTLDAETLAALMARARKMLAFGDVSSARLLLERAASAQDASAAFLLARTYDPAVLGVRDTRSITADPELARGWYRKAARLGSAEAQQRLSQLQNDF